MIKSYTTKIRGKQETVHFDAMPHVGRAWSRLYKAASDAISNKERFCYSTFVQNIEDNGNIGCASTAIALNLSSDFMIRKITGAKPIFEIEDGFQYFYFPLGDNEVYKLITKYIENNFTIAELTEMQAAIHGAGLENPPTKLTKETVADDIATTFIDNFIIETNDQFKSENNIQGEAARAKHVKYVLKMASRYAFENRSKVEVDLLKNKHQLTW